MKSLRCHYHDARVNFSLGLRDLLFLLCESLIEVGDVD